MDDEAEVEVEANREDEEYWEKGIRKGSADLAIEVDVLI